MSLGVQNFFLLISQLLILIIGPVMKLAVPRKRSRPRPLATGGAAGRWGGGGRGVQGRALCTQLGAQLIKYGTTPALDDPPGLRRAGPSAHASPPPLFIIIIYFFFLRKKLSG